MGRPPRINFAALNVAGGLAKDNQQKLKVLRNFVRIHKVDCLIVSETYQAALTDFQPWMEQYLHSTSACHQLAPSSHQGGISIFIFNKDIKIIPFGAGALGFESAHLQWKSWEFDLVGTYLPAHGPSKLACIKHFSDQCTGTDYTSSLHMGDFT